MIFISFILDNIFCYMYDHNTVDKAIIICKLYIVFTAVYRVYI